MLYKTRTWTAKAATTDRGTVVGCRGLTSTSSPCRRRASRTRFAPRGTALTEEQLALLLGAWPTSRSCASIGDKAGSAGGSSAPSMWRCPPAGGQKFAALRHPARGAGPPTDPSPVSAAAPAIERVLSAAAAARRHPLGAGARGGADRTLPEHPRGVWRRRLLSRGAHHQDQTLQRYFPRRTVEEPRLAEAFGARAPRSAGVASGGRIRCDDGAKLNAAGGGQRRPARRRARSGSSPGVRLGPPGYKPRPAPPAATGLFRGPRGRRRGATSAARRQRRLLGPSPPSDDCSSPEPRRWRARFRGSP